MNRSYSIDYELRATLPATLEAIEEFSVEFRRHAEIMLARANGFTAELLVREALTNAVVHGCHADPDKRVRCVAQLKGRRLTIKVIDDGEGFNWRAAWNHPAKSAACSGRGIEIIRKYAGRVRFNDKGNAVTITKVLPPKGQS